MSDQGKAALAPAGAAPLAPAIAPAMTALTGAPGRDAPGAAATAAPGSSRVGAAAYAQALRIGRAEVGKLQVALPRLLDHVRRGAEPPPLDVLTARSSLHRIDDALALPPPAGAETLTADRERLAADRAELPADGVALLARPAEPRTPGAVAAEGLAGASAPLPHLGLIAASFGRHDISGIQTRTGGDAAHAAGELGARAFAYGDRIGFADAPDLHTAAHEAAHVVQQRAGVALAGGIGAAGDVYEAHADAVADAVVAGESAEPLLDGMAGAGRAAASSSGVAPRAAVQRKATGTGTTLKPILPDVNAGGYAQLHLDQIVVEIWNLLWQAGLPHPHLRLQFSKAGGNKPLEVLHNELREFTHKDNYDSANSLYELLPGVHLGKLIDDARHVAPRDAEDYAKEDRSKAPKTDIDFYKDIVKQGTKWTGTLDFTKPQTPGNYMRPDFGPLGRRDWVRDVGISIAKALYDKLIVSLTRMGGRLLAVHDLDAKARVKRGDASVQSPLPLDALVLNMLTAVPLVHVPKGSARDNVEGEQALGHDRQVQYVPLGADDPRLANWIRVTSPADATVDDVIETVLTTGRTLTARDRQWMLDRASPPYFWAPIWHKAKGAAYVKLDVQINELTDFVATKHGDELVRSQFPDNAGGKPGKPGPPDADAVRAVDHARIELDVLRDRLHPWGAAGTLLFGARTFIGDRARELAADPTTLARWTQPVIAQERALRMITPQVDALLEELAASKITPQHRDQLDSVRPIIDVLVAYARAAGVSHVPQSFAPAINEASRLHTRLPLSLAELRFNDTRAGLRDQRETEVALGTGADANASDEAKANHAASPGLTNRFALLSARAARGGTLDAAALEAASIESDRLMVRARLTKLVLLLADAEQRMGKLKMPTSGSQSDPQPIRLSNQQIKALVDKGNAALADFTNLSTQTKRDRITATIAGFEKLDKQLGGFDKHLEYVNDRIADETLRDTLFKIALEMALMIATGQVIGAGMAALRGLAMARRIAVAAELVGEVRSARMVFAAGEMVFQAAGATVVQGALNDGIKREAFLENLLSNAITSVAMKPFQALLGNPAAMKTELTGWATRMQRAGKFVLRGVMDVGVGIASNKIAHSVVTGDKLASVEGQELITQAASFLAGRAIAKKSEQLTARIEKAAERYGTWHFAELRQRTKALVREAAGLGDQPKPDVAVRLMERHHELLVAERTAMQAVAQTDRTADLSVNAAELRTASTTPAEVPLRLARLELVGGSANLYTGTAQQIHNALDAAKRSGIPLEPVGKPANGVWKLKHGDRTIEVHERALRPGEKPAAPIAHAPAPKTAAPLANGAKIAPGDAGALAAELKVGKVRISDSLNDGVEIHYEKVKKPIGHELRVVEVVVGKNATIADVRGHIPTLQRISQYNGLLGQLKLIWRRVWGKPNPTNPFKQGSNGWEAVEELRKLDGLIAQRADWDPSTVEYAKIAAEVAFLTARRDHYEGVIRSAIELGVVTDGEFIIARPGDKVPPELREITIIAIAKGYPKLTDDYYYRRKEGSSSEFEVVAKPNSQAPPKKVVSKGGKLVLVANPGPEPVLIPTEMTPGRVVEKLNQDPTFDAFVELGGKLGALPETTGKRATAVETMIREEYQAARDRARKAGRDTVDFEALRSAVKDRFRAAVIKEIKKVSYTRRAELLAPLGAGDRGNLTEAWYQAKYEPDAEAHVAYALSSADAKGGTVRDDRSIDLLKRHSKTKAEAIEIKDITGPIDAGQYAAYKQLIARGKHVNGQPVTNLRYVFTKPEGALANLAMMMKDLKPGASMEGKLTIIVFDGGKEIPIKTWAEADAVRIKLEAKYGKKKPS